MVFPYLDEARGEVGMVTPRVLLHTLRVGLRLDVMATCPGWGKSQQGPFCVGIAGNGSESPVGSGLGVRE